MICSPCSAKKCDTRRSAGTVLERVGDEVEDDLLVHLSIDVDGLGERGAVHRVGQARLLHQRAERAGEVGGERCKVGRLGLCLRAAGFDAAEVEQGVDELQEAQGVPVHRLEKFFGEDRIGERLHAASVVPRIKVSGVRNSWLTFEKKAVLARSIWARASAFRRASS